MPARATAPSHAVRGRRVASVRTTRALTPAEAAWVAALPCALLLLIATLALGPPLGDAQLAPTGDASIWEAFRHAGIVNPEPTEQARYAIALLGPLLVIGGGFALAGRRLRDDVTAALIAVAQAALIAFVTASVLAQQLHVYGNRYTSEVPLRTMVLLTPATLIVAVLLALLAVWALRREALVLRAAHALRERPRARVGAISVAAAFVLLWLLSAFNTDATIELAHESVRANIAFWSDEAFALLGGHAPLVDFHAQYGHLWAYLAAGGLTLLGGSLGVYSALMLAGTAGALAAVLATFRRVAGGWPAAAALFLPFVATSFFMEDGPLANRYGPANLFSLFPIRYGGPFLLLWLVVRRVQSGGLRPPIALFALAGLVAINNLEFGLPAFAATLVALAIADGGRSSRGLARVAGCALAGAFVAVLLVCGLTLAVAGSLPRFGLLLTFPRIYAREGFGMLPMPALGLHLALYATFAAALGTAAVRARSHDAERALTTALAWIGLFGLGAGGYFVGRSHPHVLIDLFAAWALALALLLVVVVRAVARRPSRRPQLAELLVLVGAGVAICSLAQTPTPWSQIERLQRTLPPSERTATATLRVVDQLTRPGEPVALLLMLGHRIAHQLGLENVTPYASMDSMMTREQWAETVNALRAAGGRRFIVPRERLFPEREAFLQAAGYLPQREAAGLGIVEFVERGRTPG